MVRTKKNKQRQKGLNTKLFPKCSHNPFPCQKKMLDLTDAVLAQLSVLAGGDSVPVDEPEPALTPDEEALAVFVRTAEQLAAEIDAAQRALSEPPSVLGAAGPRRTPRDAEAQLRACCESVRDFRAVVDAAVARVGPAGAGTAAHLRAACRALYTRAEDLAAVVQRRKQAALERERARARRYGLLPGQATPAAVAVRRRAPPRAAETSNNSGHCGSDGGGDNAVDLETAVLDAENAMLVEQIAAQETSPLQQVERQIAEVAEMQAALAQKVLEQADDINVLREQAARSLANIDEANRALRRATAPPKRARRCCGCCSCCGACADCHSLTCAVLLVLGTLLLLVNWSRP